jgi:hypothetical protein
MKNIELGDYVLVSPPGYETSIDIVVNFTQGAVLVTPHVDSYIVKAYAPENLQVITKESDPEYFI